MNWLQQNRFNARPIVAVEDHVYHISELLRTLCSELPSLISSLTVVCLDRLGPDTDAAVCEWFELYPELQVAARISRPELIQEFSEQLSVLDDSIFQDQNAYCRKLAAMIRPQGLLLQDIDLETLEFVPRDRWWESTMLATTVRGIMGQRPPRCAFISNKRGYEATFGSELLEAGHDPRDVLNKYEMRQIVVPFLGKYLESVFPLQLDWLLGGSREKDRFFQCRIADSEGERLAIEQALDVVVWPACDQMCKLGGKLVVMGKKQSISLPVDGNEIETWRQLVDAKLESRDGIEVQEVGQRVAPTGALRAEVTNSAARHLHSLRKRLTDPQAIATVSGSYRLRDSLAVGRVF